MTTTELAAVVVAGASVLGVVVLAVFLARLTRTVREVGDSVQRLRFESVPLEARAELAPPPRRPLDAGALVTQVARANPVLDVSQPVIKVLALASGTSRAATRFRRTRQQR
ncbi:MAG TPA: hypothetical protein VJ804_07540 [Acidimicrobiales bacterium]|nr:hypothetical protein [Acidimicrobiales bacterium]